ncbi:MAG: glutamate--tRNA ligase [Candidatus Eisenbacteria bacterium]
MSVRVRFAPSPTGFLHVGGARTALFNYLFARAHGGVFVLRIEDTDAARSTEASLAAILDSLRWLGLNWDEGPGVGGAYGPYAQSERRGRYLAHGEFLQEAGYAYPCWCTPEELQERRQQRPGGESPGYDRRCRQLTPEARAARTAGGVRPALRFAAPGPGETAWQDGVKGRLALRNEELDDFVLIRSDGLPTYNFACVVDDHEMAITHVIRGDDHVSNTPRQLQVYGALGWAPPEFAHVPMILGPDGARLSKRHGATSVEAYGELGFIGPALVNFLALLGWSLDGEREMFTLPELESAFTLERVGSSPAIFNVEKLEWMNGQHLSRMPDEERTRLACEFLRRRGEDGGPGGAERIGRLLRVLGERVRTLADLEQQGAFALRERLLTVPEAWSDLLAREQAGPRLEALASRLEPLADFSASETERVTRALATECGVKPGELLGAARVALTGSKVSPGIFEVMALLGRERTVVRLRDAAARWSEARAGSTPAGAAPAPEKSKPAMP